MAFTLPASGAFAGMEEATLRTMLSEAQLALHAVTIGRREVKVSYTMGDGQREVFYSAANVDALRDYIRDLNAALGQRARRAISVAFA
jgi:hypothetical protein